jgi:hypothetical protein
MVHAVISLDVTRTGRSPAGLVWTGVCLRVGDLAFPDARWTDFAVVVLGWWVRVLLALIRGAKDRQEVMFMEGPFSVEVQVTSNITWQVTCIERGPRRLTRAHAAIESRSLLDSAVQAGEGLLELCRSAGWWSTDADVLESGLHDLKEALAVLTN